MVKFYSFYVREPWRRKEEERSGKYKGRQEKVPTGQ